jgi:oligoribonuclease
MTIIKRPNIVWVDVETDRLDAHTGHLLEIAVVVTDADLNVLDDEGFHAVIYHSTDEVASMYAETDPYVIEMHTKTDLWAKVTDPTTTYSRSRADEVLRDYLEQFGNPKTMPVAGNSVRLDMNFMEEHLPETAAFLDYHMRDVSTVAGLASDWYDLPWFTKHSDHTAKLDIRESIRELKHYREAIFKSEADRDAQRRLAIIRQMVEAGREATGDVGALFSVFDLALNAPLVSETEVIVTGENLRRLRATGLLP